MREPRCIDAFVLRDMAIDSMESNPHVNKAIARNHRLEHEHFLRLIALCPTIEAEPVKHGRWIFKDDDRMPWCTQAICSHCKKVVANNVHLAVDTGQRDFVEENLYCPNCGSKMDGGADHEN